MNAKQITLTNTVAAAIADAVKADGQSDNKWAKTRDELVALGVTASMLETEKNGGDVELVNQVKAAIVMGFSKAEIAVLNKETKTLDDSGKLFKRTTQQKIGSKLARVRKLVTEQEEKDEDSTKTPVQLIQKLLDSVLAKLANLENASFDIPRAIKDTKALKGSMPSV